ncbi:MAG: hypothetical protein GW893_09645 [Armatimonadetes bacterium]|nr:hypothetical protein [Armatimonadota bacterium]
MSVGQVKADTPQLTLFCRLKTSYPQECGTTCCSVELRGDFSRIGTIPRIAENDLPSIG